MDSTLISDERDAFVHGVARILAFVFCPGKLRGPGIIVLQEWEVRHPLATSRHGMMRTRARAGHGDPEMSVGREGISRRVTDGSPISCWDLQDESTTNPLSDSTEGIFHSW